MYRIYLCFSTLTIKNLKNKETTQLTIIWIKTFRINLTGEVKVVDNGKSFKTMKIMRLFNKQQINGKTFYIHGLNYYS